MLSLFFFIFVFLTANSKHAHFKISLMTRFEPRTSGIGSDCSANWVTTAAQVRNSFKAFDFIPRISFKVYLNQCHLFKVVFKVLPTVLLLSNCSFSSSVETGLVNIVDLNQVIESFINRAFRHLIIVPKNVQRMIYQSCFFGDSRAIAAFTIGRPIIPKTLNQQDIIINNIIIT